MAAPTVYRWDDTDAPSVYGDRTSLINLLTACLVTGYGSKPAAGWTKEFVNAEGTIAAFRNDSVTGTGLFLQIDSASFINNEYTSIIQGYETMSNEMDGLGPFADIAIYVCTNITNDAVDPRQWTVIADSRGVYVFVHHYLSVSEPNVEVTADSHKSKSFYFGDIISVYDPDPYGCVLIGADASGYNWGSYLYHTVAPNVTTTIATYCARNSVGDNAIHKIAMYHGGGPSALTVPGSTGVPRSIGVFVNRPCLNDGDSYTIRGILPGYYIPCHHYSEFSHHEELVVDGKTFLAILAHGYHYNTTNKGMLFMDIGETFRP